MTTNSFPRPESLRQPGERAEGNTVVVRRRREKVHIPATLEGATKNHVYTKAIDEDNNEIMAYVEVPYDPAENQYPKMLYHPDYGKQKEPKIGDFSRSAATPEQALEMFNQAHKEWEKGNRTKIAENKEREAELKKIGWLDYKGLAHLSVKQQKQDLDAL